jgi:Trypsin-co-occurring domain 1
MDGLLRFETDTGFVVVEVDTTDPGFQSVSRRRPGEAIYEVKGRFEDALVNVRNAAQSALRTLRDGVLDPDEVEIEFGVKLNAEAGAVLAKTATEGHLAVRLTWSRAAARHPEGSPSEPAQASPPGPATS